MRKFFLVLGCLFLVFCTAGSAYSYSLTSGTWSDSEYQIVAYTGSWTVAEEKAQKLGDGWHLAGISSEKEQDFVSDLLNKYFGLPGDPSQAPKGTLKQVWIGGKQDPLGKEPDGGWSWVNGETWSYENWANSVAPEPNNTGGNEDYVALDYRHQYYGGGVLTRDWDWNDMPVGGDSSIVAFLAEKRVPLPEPATMLLLGFGLVGLAAVGRRTFFKK